MSTPREQKLVDIMFEIAFMIHSNSAFKGKSQNEIQIAAYVADQLKQCGFETQPMGSSYGVLKE
jgi:hypothetical protein